MHLLGVLWILGGLMLVYGVGLTMPMFVDLYYGGAHVFHFLEAASISVLVGSLLFRYGQKPTQLNHRDGFLVVAMTWIFATILGAAPLWTTGTCTSIADGLFESASGLTTTGATILVGLDKMDPGVLIWRSFQVWIGGMGMVVLAVAVLPMLGIGGMQLFKAEAPGPTKDKLTSRVTETAQVLWYLYLALTLIVILAFDLSGMTTFDAINHAMCTLGTGGFSTHDASFGFYPQPVIQWVGAIAMFLAGVNFTLHYAALSRAFNPSAYWRDEEFRVYLGWVLFLIAVIGLIVIPSGQATLTQVVFNIISVVSSTGFASTDYNLWPPATLFLFYLATFIAASAGSTSGGIKVVRIILLMKQGVREIKLLIHPHGIFPVRYNGTVLDNRVINAVWGFFALYLFSYALIVFLVALTGVPLVEALSGTIACMSNVGPGLGVIGPAGNFSSLPDGAKLALTFGMILGRLEVFTLLALFMPQFWKR